MAQCAGLGLPELARKRPRVLLADVEMFSRDREVRSQIGKAVERLGFRHPERCRSHTRTVALDLRRTKSEVFASIHRTARQNIKAADKNPVVVRCIAETPSADRLDELVGETMERTRRNVLTTGLASVGRGLRAIRGSTAWLGCSTLKCSARNPCWPSRCDIAKETLRNITPRP